MSAKKLGRIFEAITPDNIKDVPVIRDAMEVFIETLEELSAESIDIKNIYDNPVYRDNLRQMYLNDLYTVLKTFQLNDQIDGAIERINAQYGEEFIKKNRIDDLGKFINEEHFFSFKTYKQSKGTAASIKYIYELLSGLVMSTDTKTDFRIITNGKPFEFAVEGSLPTEVYEELVFPLAHPLGFNYIYERYMFEQLQDFFPYLRVVYDTKILEVRTLFPDGSTAIDPYINTTITAAQQIAQGLDPNLKVTNIVDSAVGETRVRDVFLSNGTYLRQTSGVTGQTQVQLLSGTGDPSDAVLRTYEDQSSIYLDYTPTYLTSIEDSLVTSENTAGSQDSVGRGTVLSEAPVPTFQEDLDALDTQDLELGVIPVSAFESQNIGNEDYLAREHENSAVDWDSDVTEVHTELDPNEKWMLINDDPANLIGDFWITWKKVEAFTDGDSYLQFDKFHQDSDADFSISVYVDG